MTMVEMALPRIGRLHDKRKTRLSLATTQPMRDGERRTRCIYKLPPKEESLVLDIEAFIKEAYDSLKVQVVTKENLIMEPKMIKLEIKEEETCQQRCSNDTSNTKAQL